MILSFRMPRLTAFLAAVLLALTAAPGWAAVSITFYSKELGSSFPHAFVILEVTLARGGPRIEEDYGFTAKTISPAKKPRAFLRTLTAQNRARLTSRQATLHRGGPRVVPGA